MLLLYQECFRGVGDARYFYVRSELWVLKFISKIKIMKFFYVYSLVQHRRHRISLLNVNIDTI